MPCTAHFSLNKERLFAQPIETDNIDEALIVAHRTTEAFAEAFNTDKDRHDRIRPGDLEVWVHLHGPWDNRIACHECGRKAEPDSLVWLNPKTGEESTEKGSAPFHAYCAPSREVRRQP